MHTQPGLSRRAVIVQATAALALLGGGPAAAEPADMARAIRDFTGGAAVTPGKIRIDVAPLVENGNSVSVALGVDHPISEASFVRVIALFNEKNPQPEIARFHLGPRSGVAALATRIRLATTQHITAIAQLSDGTFWSDTVEVIVTIAACTEE